MLTSCPSLFVSIRCILSGALLTAATLLLLTKSLSLACRTLAGVGLVLVCFIGYLSERGYTFGVVEAVRIQ